MKNKIQFVYEDTIHSLEFNETLPPTTTVLEYIRGIGKTGTKEGCAEGDCGACTVVIGEYYNGKLHYRALNSCVMFLPSLHGKLLITIENLSTGNNFHPIQTALIEHHASQCGFCTPGFTMALFAQLKEKPQSAYEELVDAITGNLCRCTGYKSIAQAAKALVGKKFTDKFDTKEQNIINLLQKIDTNHTIEINTPENLYFIPFSIQEALKLKKQYPQAIIANGGTDLVLQVTKKKQKIPQIIDISMVKELRELKINENYIHIGAGVKVEELRTSSQAWFKELSEFLSDFGAKQIRNSATVGGNAATASPVSDLAMALMTLNATVVIASEHGERKLPMDSFIKGYRKTDLKPNELIKEFIIEKPSNNQIIKLYKISKRRKLDISTVNAGFNFKIKNNIITDLRIIFGGMAAEIKHAQKTENFLKNKSLTEENILKASDILAKEFTPIDDARSSAHARSIMAKNLLLKFYYSLKN